MIVARLQPSGTFFIMKGALQLGRVVKSGDGSYWKTITNSSNTRTSFKEYESPESAAMARWGADAKYAILAAKNTTI
jgi:hypothetical protein